MKELEYPYNAEYILQKKRKIRRALLEEKKDWIEKKIAILGGSTTAFVRETLELFLLNQGIKPVFYESGYGQYYQDAVFPGPELCRFQPDLVYLYTSSRNIAAYPELSDTGETVDAMLDGEYRRFCSVWEGISGHFHCPIIQNNFELPFFRLLGNKDASDCRGAVNYITRLNMRFYGYAQEHEDFFICDMNYISADYGLKEWGDPFYWYMYKYALNVKAIPSLSFNVANIIKSILGKNKKGFVLDLDNTLWGGIVGEDGAGNLKIGPEEPAGQAYSEFQGYIKKHKQLGAVLCIDSKNDEGNALEGLNHSSGILKPEDFVSIKANWEPKDRNFAEIAAEIGILPESLVFIDDSPAERHIVTGQLKGVQAPDIGESHQYIRIIDRSGFFETTYLSEDDVKRNEMYQGNVRRAKLQSGFADYGEYLDSLQMKAVIKPFEPVYMGRIAQLTNKSNQFNLTTKRYTQAELEKVAADPRSITFYGKLEDRFGDNGIVSVLIGRREGSIVDIVLWLMSCRVLKRDMEFAMMDALVSKCLNGGVSELRGFYFPTAKNGMVKDLYDRMGFTLLSEENGSTVWRLPVTEDYRKQNKHIEVEG